MRGMVYSIDAFAKRIGGRSVRRKFELLRAAEREEKTRALLAARALCTDRNELIRTDAADLLGDLGDSTDRFRLMLLARDRSWLVRSSAIESLGMLSGSGASELIAQTLKCDRHYIVRKFAAIALGDMDDRESFSSLKEAASKERSRQVLGAIYASLIRRGESGYMGGLLELLDHDDPGLQSFIVNALGEIPSLLLANYKTEIIPALGQIASELGERGQKASEILRRSNA